MRRGDSCGFTLVEVLIASAVMLVGIYSVLAVFPQALRMTRDAGRISTLGHLATQQIEHLRSVPYADAQLAPGAHPVAATDSLGARYHPVAGFDEQYSLRWIVAAGPTDGSGAPEAEMKSLTVEATYGIRYDVSGDPLPDPRGLTVVLRTYLAE